MPSCLFRRFSPNLFNPGIPGLPPSQLASGSREPVREFSGLQGLSQAQKGEDPLQEGRHLEAPGGGDWRRLAFCRRESHRDHCGSDITVFWLNLLALTPDLGSALVRPLLLTSTTDHHDQEPHKESITTTWAHRTLTSRTRGGIRDVAECLRVRKLFGICEGWDWLPVACRAGRCLCQWGSPCVCVP